MCGQFMVRFNLTFPFYAWPTNVDINLATFKTCCLYTFYLHNMIFIYSMVCIHFGSYIWFLRMCVSIYLVLTYTIIIML